MQCRPVFHAARIEAFEFGPEAVLCGGERRADPQDGRLPDHRSRPLIAAQPQLLESVCVLGMVDRKGVIHVVDVASV